MFMIDFAGPNAIDIMRDLGLLEDILAHTPEPGKLNLTGFRFLSGAEGHEHLFTVRVHALRSDL